MGGSSGFYDRNITLCCVTNKSCQVIIDDFWEGWIGCFKVSLWFFSDGIVVFDLTVKVSCNVIWNTVSESVRNTVNKAVGHTDKIVLQLTPNYQIKQCHDEIISSEKCHCTNFYWVSKTIKMPWVAYI